MLLNEYYYFDPCDWVVLERFPIGDIFFLRLLVGCIPQKENDTIVKWMSEKQFLEIKGDL